MDTLPVPESHLSTYSGYGIATLFWMAKHKPEKLSKFDCAGTIQDFAVSMLCDLEKPTMSHQNAASWGYFDCLTNSWNTSILCDSGFPVQFLPTVVSNSDFVGNLIDDWHTIPKGTPIGVALGDLQCSVLATIESIHDAVLNISTSAQLAYVVENYAPSSGPPQQSAVEYFPYFDNKYIAVAASLNGGNALAMFVRMLQQWSIELGYSVPQSKVWEKVLSLSLEDNAISDLQIRPTLLGERHQPDISASVSNINLGNLGLGQVFRALCHGLLQNLHNMMPRDQLSEANITRIVGNGSGLSRNNVLQKEVQQLYQLPLVFTDGGDAAKGAALAVSLSRP
ncbi:hypothetical protein FQR65_LT09185 [Abscondita terminalis]|nr:hypothetical protein FQR65_LT09185 [Abscondita terminalis]